jgi:hypothetical protein
VPDWFYRTVGQPALFALPDKAARAVALGVMGVLGSNRAGRAVIERRVVAAERGSFET